MDIKLRIRALSKDGEVLSETSVKSYDARGIYDQLGLVEFKSLHIPDAIGRRLETITEKDLMPQISKILGREVETAKLLLVELSMGGRSFWYHKHI